MRTAACVSNLPQGSCTYSPEDLESTRHAFRPACDENPRITTTAAQRCGVAQAIVSRFERSLSETELTAAALGQAH